MWSMVKSPFNFLVSSEFEHYMVENLQWRIFNIVVVFLNNNNNEIE